MMSKAMRVVALDAIHVPLGDRVMIGQVELRVRLQVACVACRRIATGIDDESAAAPADFDMLASRAVAHLATRVPRRFDRLKVDTRVRASRKRSNIICMALVAAPGAHECRALDLRRRDDAALEGGARREKKSTDSQRNKKGDGEELLHPLTHLNYNPARRCRKLLCAESGKLD
jgi:hypothetical protein